MRQVLHWLGKPNLWILVVLLAANGVAWASALAPGDGRAVEPRLEPDLADLRKRLIEGGQGVLGTVARGAPVGHDPHPARQARAGGHEIASSRASRCSGARQPTRPACRCAAPRVPARCSTLSSQHGTSRDQWNLRRRTSSEQLPHDHPRNRSRPSPPRVPALRSLYG